MMQPLMPALYGHIVQSPCRFRGEPGLLPLRTGGTRVSQVLMNACVLLRCNGVVFLEYGLISGALHRYVILGNHDYGDKCYDEPPGCYVYGGDTFYSPLHQVGNPFLCISIQRRPLTAR